MRYAGDHSKCRRGRMQFRARREKFAYLFSQLELGINLPLLPRPSIASLWKDWRPPPEVDARLAAWQADPPLLLVALTTHARPAACRDIVESLAHACSEQPQRARLLVLCDTSEAD